MRPSIEKHEGEKKSNDPEVLFHDKKHIFNFMLHYERHFFPEIFR